MNKNGVEVASFTYHIDGQIATAKANGRQEHFLWDNLAMISRNETEYVNEPYVTGGNPILADGEVLLNDLFGNTIGIRSGMEYRETGMTAFGETDEKSVIFTGKPYIGDLGYAFLFRNDRPCLGKWQTRDPLGYPEGWNNFAYCNNRVISAADRFGTDIYHVYDSDRSWHGHSASIIGNPKDGYKAYNFGGAGGGYTMGNPNSPTYATAQEALAALNYGREGKYEYDKVQKWNTTPEQDRNHKMPIKHILMQRDMERF